MKYPFVSQDGIKDCGVASLLMIMKYYGGGASKEYLRDITHTTKDGVDAYSLLEAAKKFNFSTKGLKGKIEDMDQNDLPCIAHVVINNSYQHFIVIYKIDFKRKKILIADPASSIKKISFLDFNKISSDLYLCLYPVKKIPNYTDSSLIMPKIKKIIYKYRKNLICLALISAFTTFLSIVSSFEFQVLLDYVIQYSSIMNLYFVGISFMFVILLKKWLELWRNLLLHHFNHVISNSLLTDVYRKLLSLPYLYYKNHSTGEIVARVQDLENIKDFLGKVFVTCFVDTFLLITVIIVLLKLSIQLSSILIVITLILVIIILISWQLFSKRMKVLKEKANITNSYLVETISGMETVRGFGIEKYVEHNFTTKLKEYLQVSYRTSTIFTYLRSLSDLIEEIGVLLVIIVGSFMVLKDNISLGQLLTFYTLLVYFFEPIRNLFDIGYKWRDAKLSIERVDDLFQIPQDEAQNIKMKKEKIIGNIMVKDLSYQYSPKRKILNDISLEIKARDRVLIYGKSGSGKSTLAKILAGIMPQDTGSITLDKYPLSEYDNDTLKRQVCYLSQNEILFQDSVYQNIHLDSEEEYESFLDICTLCKVDEIVENNPLKYNMLLEENGFNISGGERQRIILARAIYKNADLYIFDESLNEIDIDREREILTNIFTKYPEKTFIIISHRYHNNDLFNRKIEMREGICYENN